MAASHCLSLFLQTVLQLLDANGSETEADTGQYSPWMGAAGPLEVVPRHPGPCGFLFWVWWGEGHLFFLESSRFRCTVREDSDWGCAPCSALALMSIFF